MLQVNGGNIEAKVDYAYSLFEKPVTVGSLFEENEMIDTIAITKGRGTEGVVTRWGVSRLPRKTHRGLRKVLHACSDPPLLATPGSLPLLRGSCASDSSLMLSAQTSDSELPPVPCSVLRSTCTCFQSMHGTGRRGKVVWCILQVACIGAWHPARVSWTVARAGQHGFHHRTEMNKKIYKIGVAGEASHEAATEFDPTKKEITPMGGFPHYGIVNEDYLMLKVGLRACGRMSKWDDLSVHRRPSQQQCSCCISSFKQKPSCLLHSASQLPNAVCVQWQRQ